MNHYELTVVVSGKLEEDAKNAVLDKVKDLVARFGGEVKNVNDLGKKRFAYEIQKMRDGYYTFIKFDAESDAPKEIESRMRIMENVVRYLIVTDELPDQVIEERKTEQAAKENEAEEEASEEEVSEEEPEEEPEEEE
ncbi:MAG: 30S ribosomal protein S6 [Lachnospiraceae bacterium]|nr:30S ribosomal protein S6 [Lachnospiraceae bacterium]